MRKGHILTKLHIYFLFRFLNYDWITLIIFQCNTNMMIMATTTMTTMMSIATMMTMTAMVIDDYFDHEDYDYHDYHDNHDHRQNDHYNHDVGLPAYSHHDRFPPWWVFVRDDNGGNLSGDKIPPLMMIIINHLTQFNSSH